MAAFNQLFQHMFAILMYLWDYLAVTMTNYTHQSCVAFGYKPAIELENADTE